MSLVYESYSSTLSQLLQSRDPQALSAFILHLDRTISSKDLQLDIFQNCSHYLFLFSDLTELLLNSYQSLYIKLEKNIINWLSHPSLIISNLALLLLIHISSYLPQSRLSQITEYFVSETMSLRNLDTQQQYLRYLARVSDVVSCFTEKRYDLAVGLAEYMVFDQRVYEFVKQEMQNHADWPAEAHWVLARVAGENNVEWCFKRLASKMWIASNSQKLKRNECLALLEYASLQGNTEVGDMEVLKSIIFSLNAGIEYLNNCRDEGFVTRARVLIRNIDKIQVGEKHREKVKDRIVKMQEKIANEYQESFSDYSNLETEELVGFGETLCKHRLDIIPSILEIQRTLKINSSIEIIEDYTSVLKALEEITAHIRKNMIN